jgi:hypothetical protein
VDSFHTRGENSACSLHHINGRWLITHYQLIGNIWVFHHQTLKLVKKIGDAMPYHYRSAIDKPESCTDGNRSPDAKFVLAFNPTFQRLQNASILNKFSSAEKQFSQLQCFLACILFVFVLFVSSEQLILFHATVLPQK